VDAGSPGETLVNTLHHHDLLPEVIVAESRRMRELLAAVERVAALTVPVCLIGEPGTGKSLVARTIHLTSQRRNLPFVEVDCAAGTEAVESPFFGRARRASTASSSLRAALVARAGTGTLVIDQVAELPHPLQTQVLSLVQSGEVTKGGGTKPIKSDVRLITTTNRPLERGRFRADLYYWISAVSLHIPPLRQRREDVPVLADHFLQRSILLHGRSHKVLSRRASEFLVDYSWPGNVRELQQAIEWAVVRAKGPVIDLPLLAEARTDLVTV
jgi:DNA-binding NtrC family response regulator